MMLMAVYSDIEFVIPAPRSRKDGSSGERAPPRKIYANKKLLCRCEYFEAMFNGGFREVEGVFEDVRPAMRTWLMEGGGRGGRGYAIRQ
jgi:hypothetical protein